MGLALATGMGLVSAGAGAAAAAPPAVVAAGTTVAFTTTGCTTWTVPAGITSVDVQAIGAAGAAGGATNDGVVTPGGLGDGVFGRVSGLAGGTQLTVCVNQGGGASTTAARGGPSGGRGGGASGVSLGSDFSQPLVVAGGGGGGGGANNGYPPATAGGDAGIPVAESADSVTAYGVTWTGGAGGDNSSATGGAGGVNPGQPLCSGTAGTAATTAGPGVGGSTVAGSCAVTGGGGGGGYRAGGGGSAVGIGATGGGGGTDYVAPSVANPIVTPGAGTVNAAGSGAGSAQVTITYAVPPSALAQKLVDDSRGKGAGLTLAVRALAIKVAVDSGQTAQACDLTANYLAVVRSQTPRSLSAADAALLTADATALRTSLGC